MFINTPTDNIKVLDPWERADLAALDAIAPYPVALIGDVQQRVGMMCAALRPATKNARFAGTILPVMTREGDNLAIHRAIDEARPGDVLVINGNSEVNRSVFGDILGEICLAAGIVGVVIDGSVRDVEELEKLGLPVFARGICPAGPTKTGPGTVGLPVACGNIVCYPGDAIFADPDGIIVVSKQDLPACAKKVPDQDAFENALRERVRASVAK
jgi:RraA family protein